MTNSTSIIKKIAEKTFIPTYQRRLTALFGYKPERNPNFYRNKLTGEEYSFITGASAWPDKAAPGFIVILVVLKSTNHKPTFSVVEEFETDNISVLLRKCVELRDKWGYWEGPRLFRPWHCDSEKYIQLLTDFNISINKKDDFEHGFYPAPPTVLEDPNCFNIIVRQIYAVLDAKNKSLMLDDANLLRNHVLNLRKNDPKTWKTEKHPAIMALGMAIHVLLEQQPWLDDGEIPQTVPTDLEEVAEHEERITNRYFGQDEYDFEADGEYEYEYEEEQGEEYVSTVGE